MYTIVAVKAAREKGIIQTILVDDPRRDVIGALDKLLEATKRRRANL